MSGHSRPKLLVVICVLAAALTAFRAHAQPATPPAGQSPAPSAPPADAPKTTPDMGCKTPSKASAGGASVIEATEGSVQHKRWQARGGEIQFTVKSFVTIPADASVLVCFRWISQSERNREFIERRPSRLDLSSDGKLLKVTTAVPHDLGPQPSDVDKEHPLLFLVPLAEVRILAINNSTKEAAADATTTIGITNRFWASFITLITVGLGLGILLLTAGRRLKHPGIQRANWLLRIISAPNGFASLSQFQIILWTFVVAASAVYVMSLSGQLIQITNGMLVLLGIAGAAGIGAKAHDENQRAAAEATATKAAAERDEASNIAAQKEAAKNTAIDAGDTLAVNVLETECALATKQVTAKTEIAAATRAKADALKKPRTKEQRPQWSDLIVNQSVEGDTREIDVARFQMLLFTLVTAVFVFISVMTTYVIPEIPAGFQTLLGISNGVYLGSKIAQRS